MDRRRQYKHKPESTEGLRAKRRIAQRELRKARREKLINSKRVRLSSLGEDDVDITEDQVKEAAKALVEKTGDTSENLAILRKAFGQGSLLIDDFLSTEKAMTALVEILSGKDPDLQLQAAWCLSNMAAGTQDEAEVVLKEAGAYLITYLSSGNAPLQDQCSWAVGNIAGDCPEFRDTLIQQGAIQPLVNLLQSSFPKVVRSAAFALSNLARGENADIGKLLEHNLIPELQRHLVFDSEDIKVITEVAWVLTYIAASGKYEDELLAAGTLENVIKCLVAISKEDPDNFEVLTPLLRCLGNMCNAPDPVIAKARQNEDLVPALGKFLQSEHRHVKKESLWVISNMAWNVDLCQDLITHQLLAPIIRLASAAYDIKKEAAYCLCNIASHGEKMCQELLGQGALQAMIPLLKNSDMEDVHLALCFAEMMMRMTDTGVKVFEDNGGLDALEPLEYHNNEELRREANQLLGHYFYKEDEEENGTKVQEEQIEQSETVKE